MIDRAQTVCCGADPRRPTPAEKALYSAVGQRHSNRLAFLDWPVPSECRYQFQVAARAEGAWLDMVTGHDALNAVAEMAESAEEILHRDEAYAAEMATWTRGDRGAPDGVARDVGGPAPTVTGLLPRRHLDRAPGQSNGSRRPTGRDYRAEPLVAVLGSYADTRRDEIIAGQALQRILLVATEYGLAASMLSQPIQVPTIREQLRRKLGRYGPPQMVLRVGYSHSVSVTSRRPLDEVIFT